MNTPKEIGEYVKQLRKLKGLTQAEMAASIGIAPNTYTQFETGKTNMTLATLNRISDALGYDLLISFVLKKEKRD